MEETLDPMREGKKNEHLDLLWKKLLAEEKAVHIAFPGAEATRFDVEAPSAAYRLHASRSVPAVCSELEAERRALIVNESGIIDLLESLTLFDGIQVPFFGLSLLPEPSTVDEYNTLRPRFAKIIETY